MSPQVYTRNFLHHNPGTPTKDMFRISCFPISTGIGGRLTFQFAAKAKRNENGFSPAPAAPAAPASPPPPRQQGLGTDAI